MPKNTLIILGIFTALLPFVGIPGSWKTPLYFVLGIAIAFFAYQREYRKKTYSPRPRRAKNQTEETTPVSEATEEVIETREDNPSQNS